MINFRSTSEQVFLVKSILWLYKTLNDYISGSGSTDETDIRMKEIRDWLEARMTSKVEAKNTKEINNGH